MKRHIVALLHRNRCNRDVLIPMLEKLTDAELEALWRLLENVKEDAGRNAKSKVWKGLYR